MKKIVIRHTQKKKSFRIEINRVKSKPPTITKSNNKNVLSIKREREEENQFLHSAARN